MKRILVVDDDIDILTVVQLVLESNGFEVIAISDWKQIYPQIDAFKPNLILLDVSLGTQDGRNICKQLKSSNETRHISVILFSANHNVEKSVSECLADSFISKPFDINNLIEGINNQLMETNGFN
ncbi:MAG TPA: response regulator [Chitinophagaceae bacterium]|nr:response regulator [Chitinophagaceae bacterium]